MKNLTFLLLTVIAFSLMSCGVAYTIKESKPVPTEIAAAKTISVSWLDMNPSNWKEMTYASQKDWETAIDDLNVNGLQKFLKEDNNNQKTITFRKYNEGPANNVDLNIELKMVKYEFNRSVMWGGTDNMHTEVRFLNKEGKEIYSATVNSTIKGGNGWAMNGMEGRLNQCIYNLEQFIVSLILK